MNTKELLSSPLAAVSTVLAFIGHALGYVDVIASGLWLTVGTWFPAISVSANQLLPMFGSVTLPFIGVINVGGLAKEITLVAGVIYVMYLGDKAVDKIRKNTDSDT